MTDKMLQNIGTLKSEDGGNIHLTFLSIDLEDDSYCSFDYVEVIYGECSEKFCGKAVPWTICGSSITVKFHSNDWETGAGFQAVWEELPKTTQCPIYCSEEGELLLTEEEEFLPEEEEEFLLEEEEEFLLEEE